MLQTLTRLSWWVLASIHLIPASVLLRPTWLQELYGVPASGELGLLLVHRAALFLAIAALCAYAALQPGAQRAASLGTAISVLGFLLVYACAGFPAGGLRKIAIVDAAAVAPLLWVLWASWVRPRR